MKIQLYQSKGYALLIAVLPIILMYKIPIIGLGAATVFLALGALYACVVLISRIQYINIKLLFPLYLYLLYAISKGGIQNMILMGFVALHISAVSTGAVNIDWLKKIIETVSIIAAVCVILQYIVHILFDVHIPMIVNSMCLDDLSYYSQAILTGVGRNSTSYRPSAFFLEPAHMTLYCVVGLILILLREKPNYKKAILISFGIITTTSGMGIVLTAATWCIFPFLSSGGATKKMQRILLLVIGFSVALMLLSRMTFFQNALARIIGPVEYSSTQYNALWGRTAKWGEFITPMKGSTLLWGYGNQVVDNAYFTGLMTLIYRYGVVGTVLFYLAQVVFFVNSKDIIARIVIIVYAVMVPMADLVGFINVIFYFGIVVALIANFKESNSLNKEA